MSFATCARRASINCIAHSTAISQPRLRRRRSAIPNDRHLRLSGLLARYGGRQLPLSRLLFARWLALRIVCLAHLTGRANDSLVVGLCSAVDPTFAAMLSSTKHGLSRPWAELDSFIFEGLGLAMDVDRLAPHFTGQIFKNSDAVARALSNELTCVRTGRPAGVVRTAAGPAGGAAGKPPQIEASFEIPKPTGRPLLLAIDGKRNAVSTSQVQKLSADCRGAHSFAYGRYSRVQGLLAVAGGSMSVATFLDAVDAGIFAVEIQGLSYHRSGRVA